MIARLLVGWMLVGGAGAQVVTPAARVCKVIAPDAMDGPVASPENHTVLYEDADVRVLDVHSAPHTIEKMHTHARPAVMYVDSQGAGRYFTPEDMVGRSRGDDPAFKFRVFATKPEGLHATENTGDVPFHAIRVEFKHPGCSLDGAPAIKPDALDAVAVEPGDHKVLFENDDVRVLDVINKPHTKEAAHTHPWPGFFYIVQRAPVRYFTPEQPDPPVRNLPAGMKILPLQPEGPHWVENVGDVEFHVIRFELKHGSVAEEK